MAKKLLTLLLMTMLSGTASAIDFATELASAQQGDPAAMQNVGALHARGVDGKKNYQEALAWFQRGAMRGYYQSMYSVGIMHERGQGIAVDPVQASAWYTLAAEYIPKNADEWFIPRAKVAMFLRNAEQSRNKLSPEQQAQAQTLTATLRAQISASAAPPEPAVPAAHDH